MLNALTIDEAGRHAQLVGSQTKGFTGLGFGHAAYFKQNVAGADNGHPAFHGALALTHTSIRGTGRKGLLRENADEHLTFTFQVTVNRNTAGFNLVVGDPTAVEHLKAEVTKGNIGTAGGIAGTAAAVHLAVLHSFGH